jgi:hypothetical protein
MSIYKEIGSSGILWSAAAQHLKGIWINSFFKMSTCIYLNIALETQNYMSSKQFTPIMEYRHVLLLCSIAVEPGWHAYD